MEWPPNGARKAPNSVLKRAKNGKKAPKRSEIRNSGRFLEKKSAGGPGHRTQRAFCNALLET